MEELARRRGRFGLIRVFERRSDSARLYCVDGGVQTMTDVNGVSLFGYVHALKLLLRDAQDILILGGAGGSLATMLARRGSKVTVVDIDPAALGLAQRYFELDPGVRWITNDALSYVRRTRDRFDTIVVDACDAHQTHPAFLAIEWIAQAMERLGPSGSLFINIAGDELEADYGWRLASNLAQAGWHCVLWRPEAGFEGNELLRVSANPVAATIDTSDIMTRPAEARTYLLSLAAHTLSPAARTAYSNS